MTINIVSIRRTLTLPAHFYRYVFFLLFFVLVFRNNCSVDNNHCRTYGPCSAWFNQGSFFKQDQVKSLEILSGGASAPAIARPHNLLMIQWVPEKFLAPQFNVQQIFKP